MDAQGGTVDIKDLVEQYTRSNWSPSGIVAVANRGSIVQQHAWGGDGYDETTPFRIASCTKSFTALGILMLRRAGKLQLDDVVTRHLPELRVEADPAWPVLRITHLLSMTSGLATDNPWGDRQEAATREQLSAWAAGGLRLIFAPGTSFEYSNLGYALLGEIISRASGQDFRAFVRERIIDPLGLADTRFAAGELPAVAPGWHREPMLPGQPGGWTPQEPSPPGAFSAIGGLWSSVRDLVAWANLYLSREVPEGVGFTAADLLEAQEPLTMIGAAPAPAPLHGPAATGYGFGLLTEKFSGHGKLVSHAGGYPGFLSYMCWHVESGTTVVASANGTHAAVPMLARQVMMRHIAQTKSTADTVTTWPETDAAVAALTALVHEAAQAEPEVVAARHAALFADNVELDFPLRRRLEHLRAGLVNLGSLREPATPAVSERPCRARWTVPADYGALELFLELAPVAPFGVQTFSAEMVNGAGRVKLF